MKTRIYVTGEGQETRLVRAQNRLYALDHITKGKINITSVKKDQLELLMSQGIKIEDATGGKQEEIK